MKEIQLKDAKATLSAVIDEAQAGEQVVITRHGRKEAVVLSWAEYQRLAHVPTFGRLLMSAPLSEGEVGRSEGPLRDAGF